MQLRCLSCHSTFQHQSLLAPVWGTQAYDCFDVNLLPLQALLRPGRFDRQISIDRPDIVGREQIFRVYLEKIKLDKPIKHYSERMAALTPGAVVLTGTQR